MRTWSFSFAYFKLLKVVGLHHKNPNSVGAFREWTIQKWRRRRLCPTIRSTIFDTRRSLICALTQSLKLTTVGGWQIDSRPKLKRQLSDVYRLNNSQNCTAAGIRWPLSSGEFGSADCVHSKMCASTQSYCDLKAIELCKTNIQLCMHSTSSKQLR